MRAVNHPQSAGKAHLSLQGLINQVAGYGVGAVINRVLGIIVACIYPMLLSKDEYGRLDVIFSLTSILAVVFYLGLDALLPRFYYEYEGERRKKLVSSVFYVVVTFTVVAIAILLLFSKPLSLWLYQDPRYIFYFRLMLISMPFLMANSVSLLILRMQARIRIFNVLMAANLVLAAIFGVFSILGFNMGAAGVLIGFIAGNAATGILGVWLVRSEFILAAAPNGEMKKLLDLGAPLVLSGAAMWLIGYVNRPILVHRVSADDLGLFAIASGAVGMFGLLIGAFRNAWQPFAFSIMGREGYQSVYGQTLTLFTAAGATAAAGLALFAPQVLLLINLYTQKNWSGAAPSVGPLAMGTVFSAMYLVVQTGAFIARRTSVIAITVGIAALINLLLNFWLIPYWGIMGAAIATALGHLTALIAGYLFAQRLSPIPYHIGKLTITVAAASLAIAMGSTVDSGSRIGDVLLKLLILIAYCGVLFATRTINRRDLQLFRNINWFGHNSESPAIETGTGDKQAMIPL